MDQALADRLNSLTEQNKTLGSARARYLLKESERKHFEALLIKKAAGKSHAERTINAQATRDWLEFQQVLAGFESEFEFEKLKYEILDKAYLAEHLSMKLDAGEIKRQV